MKIELVALVHHAEMVHSYHAVIAAASFEAMMTKLRDQTPADIHHMHHVMATRLAAAFNAGQKPNGEDYHLAISTGAGMLPRKPDTTGFLLRVNPDGSHACVRCVTRLRPFFDMPMDQNGIAILWELTQPGVDLGDVRPDVRPIVDPEDLPIIRRSERQFMMPADIAETLTRLLPRRKIKPRGPKGRR